MPLLFRHLSMDLVVAKYFACTARASLSPSALAKRSMAIRLLVERCEELKTRGCVSAAPSSWLCMLPALLQEAGTDFRCRALIADAWEFLVYLEAAGHVEEAPLRQLLAHTGFRSTSQSKQTPRGLLEHIVPNISRRRTGLCAAPPPPSRPASSRGTRAAAFAFPENRMFEFFVEGLRRRGAKARRMARGADERLATDYNVKAILYFLLLAFGCLRGSEPLHLYVSDIKFDFEFGTGAFVSIWDPISGPAPARLDGSARDRKTYLMEEFRLRPRNLGLGNARVGFKNLLLDDMVAGVGQRTRVFWLVPEVGKLFWRLNTAYLAHVRPIASSHPFFFSSSSNFSIGTPWTLDSAEDAFDRSVRKIGLEPDASKGLCMHGFRHRGKHWMDLAGVSAADQQAVLHHQSIKSQAEYGRVGPIEVAELLRKAGSRPGVGGPTAPATALPSAAVSFVSIGRAIASHFGEAYDDLV